MSTDVVRPVNRHSRKGGNPVAFIAREKSTPLGSRLRGNDANERFVIRLVTARLPHGEDAS